MHQKFSNHVTLFQQFPSLTIEAKIKIYTLKILKNFENAKLLCGNESISNKERNLYPDEIELQKIGLDYDTIHSEILENIIFDENDSGISDFDIKEEENHKKKIFEINKIKTIIHQSVKTLFEQNEDDEQFKPLFQQEKDLNNENINITNEGIEKNTINAGINDEIKTKENTQDFIEIKKENNIIPAKEKIVNYKKYNFLTDPYSNYNNFSKKYIIIENKKKRCRDIHPFLKTFNPKFLKKENINKKIFRRFRKFFKSFYKGNKNLPIFSKNELFWKKFFKKNLLPPVKIEENNGQKIEYKSFNSKYLLWLFNQEGTSELFKIFIKKEKDNVINNFITEYNLNESKEPNIIDKISEYLDYIPEIYEKQNIKLLRENADINNDENELMYKKEDSCNLLESLNNINIKEEIDGQIESSDNEMRITNSSNNSNYDPFNINIEMIDKKNFREFPYENYDTFLEKEENSLSHYHESINGKEIVNLNDSLSELINKAYYN